MYDLIAFDLQRALPHLVLVARQHLGVVPAVHHEGVDKAGRVVFSIGVETRHDGDSGPQVFVGFGGLVFGGGGGRFGGSEVDEGVLEGAAFGEGSELEGVGV